MRAGEIVDISADGVCIASSTETEPGRQIGISLTLPFDVVIPAVTLTSGSVEIGEAIAIPEPNIFTPASTASADLTDSDLLSLVKLKLDPAPSR